MSFNEEDEDVIGSTFGGDDDLSDDDLDLEDPEKLPVDEEDGYDPEDRFH